MHRRFHLIFCLLVCLTSHGITAAATPEKVDVELNTTPAERLSGTLVSWDNNGIIIKAESGERSITWSEMTPQGAFRLRQRLTDRTKAEDLLALGEMGRAMGIDRPATQVIEQAVRRDPALRERADVILQKKPGFGLQPAEAASESAELLVPMQAGEPPVVVYRESTPAEDAAAIEFARARTREVEAQLNLKLDEFQTPHFIVFTDWDKREYGFLQKNLEGAYRAVAKVFDEDPRQSVFEGKLAIYMFAQQEDFKRFATAIGGWPDVPDRMAGYFGWRGQVIHMAMWKPDMRRPGITREIAELQWAFVLGHEFVHAFTFRYKTSRMPPLWVNEGLAEAVAMDMFPMMSDYRDAYAMMQRTPSLRPFWGSEMMQRQFDFYPVNRTLVETLLAKDRKAFIKWFDAMKDGQDAETALKEIYKWDFDDLERYWRRYVEAVSRRR